MSRTTTSTTNENSLIEMPKKSYEVFKIDSRENSLTTTGSAMENGGSILVTMYKNTNGQRANNLQPYNPQNSFEMSNTRIYPQSNNSIIQRASSVDPSFIDERLHSSLSIYDRLNMSAFSSPSFDNWNTDIISKTK